MNKLGKVAVALVMAFSVGAAGAESVINIPAGATQADIVQALSDVDEGGTVRLAEGTYTLSSVLTISRGVTLQGAGAGLTTLKGDGGDHYGIKVSNADAVVCDLTLTAFKQEAVNSVIGSALLLQKGLVRDCRITKNNATRYNSKGGAVYLTGGTLLNCVVDNNKSDAGGGSNHSGGGIYMTSGLVDGCLVVSNVASKSDANYNIDNVYIIESSGGGVYMTGGTLRNSTIAHNYSRRQGGGVYLSGTTGRIENCLIAGNGSEWNDSAYGHDLGPKSATNYCSNVWTGNLADAFARQGSTYAEWYAPTAHCPDAGCYPYAGTDLACGIGAAKTAAVVGHPIVLTGIVHNATDPVDYVWTVTAPSGVTSEYSGAEPTVTLSECGRHTVDLVVNGTVSAPTRTDWLVGTPLTNYVSQAGTGVWPYATPAEATTSLQEAIDAQADGGVVAVLDGMTITKGILIEKDVTVVGPGRDVCTIQTKTANVRILDVNSPGAVVKGFTIKGASYGTTFYYNGYSGARIGLNGGTIADCRITGNKVTTYYGAPCVGLFGSKAVMTRTIIDNNTSGRWLGAGILLHNGLLDNCLVYGNTANDGAHGAGVVLTTQNGRIRNCTIAKNTSSTGSGGGIYFKTTPQVDQIINTMLVENTANSQTYAKGKPDWAMATVSATTESAAATAFVNCAFEGAEVIGGGSVKVSAPFENAAANDFHLTSGPAVDGGTTYEGLAETDLDGKPRCSGGSAPDIGCYEVDKTKFNPTFSASPTEIFEGGVITFEPDLTGAPDGVSLRCEWTCVSKGNVTNTFTGSTGLAETFDKGGIYSATLDVYNDLTGVRLANYSRKNLFLVAARTNYVTAAVATATPCEPFGSRETASTNLNEILDSYAIDGSVIILDAGQHLIRKTVELAKEITLTGASRETTFLKRTKGFTSTARTVYINHASAVVENLSLCGAEILNDGSIYSTFGRIVNIGTSGGTLRHVVASNNVVNTYYVMGAVAGCESSKGVITHCLFADNRTCYHDQDLTVRGTVAIKAGRIDNSVIARNRVDGMAGLVLNGSGSAYNCTVVDNVSTNSCPSKPSVDGPRSSGGLGIFCGTTGSEVGYFNGVCRNCLFARNSGKVLRVAAKYAPEYDQYGTSSDYIGTDAYIQNCQFGLADSTAVIGKDCVIGAPTFIDADHGDYRITDTSIGRRGGRTFGQAWMRTTTDFWERPRVTSSGNRVDIGAYEANPIGFLLLVK